MSSLDLALDETDPDLKEVHGRYSDWKAFGVLKRYLNPDRDLSKEQTAQLIHGMLPNADEQHLAGQPNMLIHVIVDVARQISYSHPAQARLVRLLKWLEKSDRLTKLHNLDGFSFYFHMEDLGMTVRGCFEPYFPPGTPDERCYVNFRAFIARLSTAGVTNELSWAIWTMRDTLETLEPDADRDIYSGCISGAAVWITCAGQWLFDEIVREPGEIGEWEERAWSNGPLYSGPLLGMERWRFWQRGFALAVEGEGLNGESKRLAKKAMNLMNCFARDGVW